MEKEEDKNGWSEYGRLVLKELERLNGNYESLSKEFADKFDEINRRLAGMQNTEKTVMEMKVWQEKVNDVWSPTQMKETKDEVYRQKSRWTAAVAIITFVQIIIGILLAIQSKVF